MKKRKMKYEYFEKKKKKPICKKFRDMDTDERTDFIFLWVLVCCTVLFISTLALVCIGYFLKIIYPNIL